MALKLMAYGFGREKAAKRVLGTSPHCLIQGGQLQS
jgi:hypothetical protein